MLAKVEDIAWAAGLFEGEGCITDTDTRNPNNPLLQMTMTDEDVMKRFIKIVGYGNLTEVNRLAPSQKEYWKPQFKWAVRKKKEVKRMLLMFLPYLGERRACKALDALDKQDKIF